MMRFPILEFIAKFFEGNGWIYLLWLFSITGLIVFGGLGLKDGLPNANYILAGGLTLWLIGILVAFIKLTWKRRK
jgi:hypothetical protein